nr:hypothetical protein [Vibrio cholerae]
MVSDIAMYELRERKQQAYNAVCSDFVVNHNIEQLAKRISLDGNRCATCSILHSRTN